MRHIVFLSGAGISAESGISTFRDAGGLWDQYNVMDVCSAEAFRRNRQFILDFYNKRRRELVDKKPNASHQMIADLQKEFPGQVINVTQNIDDLFEKAGCTGTVHLHGELTKARCEACGTTWNIGYTDIVGIEVCPHCGAHLVRHHIVMFNEQAPEYMRLYEILDELHTNHGMLVVIGTSGLVLPVEDFARYASYSVLNNLEPQDAINGRVFDVCIYEKASIAAPKVGKLVRDFLNGETQKGSAHGRG